MANEKRLISLDEALKATHSEIYWTESQQSAVRSFLVKQPKVDAVEVVRCKDCKLAVVHPSMADSQKLVCTKSVNWRVVEPGHFCSYGEGRDNA